MTVPFLNVGATYQELKADIDTAIARVLANGCYIHGPEVEAFEEEFAAYCGADHAVGTANGLDALVLALRALEIGPGDDVLVPSNTFIATWLAVTQVGATPVPVEPDPVTHNMDPARLTAALTPRSKAIIPVHLYGQPVDLGPIIAFARAHGLAVIEDAAQAHGALYKGQRIGAHGDIVCWSFYPGKNLGAFGDGGAVTTNSAALADTVRVLGSYGARVKYHHEARGVNSRLDPLQAAVLRIKLQHLDAWNNRRRQIAARYLEAFSKTALMLPCVPDWAEPVWHLFVVRTDNRACLQDGLTKAGVGSQIHYPVAPFQQPAYSNSGQVFAAQSIAAQLAQEVLSLPIGPHLQAAELERVIAAVCKYA
jgi:dTDP-4-amino-4,6-dideoxygalactose transaminase